MGVDINYDKDNQVCSFGVPYKVQKIFDDHPSIFLGEGKANMTGDFPPPNAQFSRIRPNVAML